ncbi:uncharacterized protein Aud_008868 [Aspergillus udagawae]|uniref:Uncharacterized protein n=1 Tax=Aspergillus udagawae TaxID=91492 RepID=A0A8E0QVT4_9EURO|nr:uncharacterized protein Aud_008868 [Aspergillus udagawae]GIC92402.1 hypothetical protein Aud_008868 [Aspergillus udagawae]
MSGEVKRQLTLAIVAVVAFWPYPRSSYDEDNYAKVVAIPGAVRKTLDDAPGGGEMVTFERPDGTFFHVVYGQREREVEAKTPPTATHDSQDPFNTPFEKLRKGQFQRYRD